MGSNQHISRDGFVVIILQHHYAHLASEKNLGAPLYIFHFLQVSLIFAHYFTICRKLFFCAEVRFYFNCQLAAIYEFIEIIRIYGIRISILKFIRIYIISICFSLAPYKESLVSLFGIAAGAT